MAWGGVFGVDFSGPPMWIPHGFRWNFDLLGSRCPVSKFMDDFPIKKVLTSPISMILIHDLRWFTMMFPLKLSLKFQFLLVFSCIFILKPSKTYNFDGVFQHFPAMFGSLNGASLNVRRCPDPCWTDGDSWWKNSTRPCGGSWRKQRKRELGPAINGVTLW